MSIYAFYGDHSQLSNERLMFEQLLTQLKLYWQYSDEWIYLCYNSMWNGQEVDVIAFTRHAILVIDLKNYSGVLDGSENGEWTIDHTVRVKGGSQINPFVQIRKNKFAVLEWFKSHGLFSNQNLGFISGCIIFNELQDKKLDLSSQVRKWFTVTDIPHAADHLSQIRSPGIELEQDDILYLIQQRKLKPYQWDQTQSPREIRYLLENQLSINDDVRPAHMPGRKLKYSLNELIDAELPSTRYLYLAFISTLLFALCVAFYLAMNMYASGRGGFYLHDLLF